jgi:two-component system cell cycle sensor histidine kinase/response regulator CckA
VDVTPSAPGVDQQRLRHIVEHAQDLIYYCDPTGVFTFVNPAAARVMQYAEDELIGRHFLTLIRDDYLAAAGAHYARQLGALVPTTYFEFPAVARDGTIVWLGQHVQLTFENNQVAAVHAIARDITRQKAAEERLKQSEERYRSLIHGAAYGIFRTGVDGAILEANPALAQMLGYATPEELMALNMSAIYKAREDRAALIDRYNRTRSPTLSADVTWIRKDGSDICVHFSARIVRNEDGSVGFEGIAEDITEKRALEEQLRRAQKMEAVGLLARGVAHDFNNVLAAIMGTADLLALRLKHEPIARADADEIREAAQRGAALTKQLLAFSRSQRLAPKQLDLALFVRQIETMLERLAGRGYTIALDTGSAPVFVLAEPGQLEQVLLNLVANARDAMAKGGTIHVAVSGVELDERSVRRYSGIPPGRYARLAVRDTGVGIDPALRTQIFEPFFSTKGSAGTGLGLSIVYGIARDAGGTVTFETVEHEGTTFEVMLPSAPPTSPDPGI